jgi:radial spoke head protein 4A
VKLAEAEALNERFPKAGEELKDPEQWKHHEVELNALGRVRAMPEQLDENGDPVEVEDPVEPNPPLDAIKPEAWSIRAGPTGAGMGPSACAVAKSLVWPGAVAVASGRRFINIYVGYGVPYQAESYQPPLPQPTQSEWAPGEEEAPLSEEADVRADPTPPKEEEGEEE